MADTFYDQIAANRRNSLLLALFVIALFGVLGFAIGYAIAGSSSGAVAVMAIAILFGSLAAAGSYFAGDSVVLSVSGAKEVDETSAPQLLHCPWRPRCSSVISAVWPQRGHRTRKGKGDPVG